MSASICFSLFFEGNHLCCVCFSLFYILYLDAVRRTLFPNPITFIHSFIQFLHFASFSIPSQRLIHYTEAIHVNVFDFTQLNIFYSSCKCKTTFTQTSKITGSLEFVQHSYSAAAFFAKLLVRTFCCLCTSILQTQLRHISYKSEHIFALSTLQYI